MVFKNTQITPAKVNVNNVVKRSQFYKGYSTVNSGPVGSIELYDFELIKQDLINQFNTRRGERVMLPQYGTVIWSLIFEPFTVDIKQAITDDINLICNSDPRVIPIQYDINEQEYGILMEVTLLLKDTDVSEVMKLAFDKELGLIPQ